MRWGIFCSVDERDRRAYLLLVATLKCLLHGAASCATAEYFVPPQYLRLNLDVNTRLTFVAINNKKPFIRHQSLKKWNLKRTSVTRTHTRTYTHTHTHTHTHMHTHTHAHTHTRTHAHTHTRIHRKVKKKSREKIASLTTATENALPLASQRPWEWTTSHHWVALTTPGLVRLITRQFLRTVIKSKHPPPLLLLPPGEIDQSVIKLPIKTRRWWWRLHRPMLPRLSFRPLTGPDERSLCALPKGSVQVLSCEWACATHNYLQRVGRWWTCRAFPCYRNAHSQPNELNDLVENRSRMRCCCCCCILRKFAFYAYPTFPR